MNFNHVKAQDNGFFDQVWLDEGLSQSGVTSIAQDQQGFVWFGTQDGLNRYDGKQVDKFNFQPFNPSSIAGNTIIDINNDTTNALWIMTNSGLDLLELSTFKASHVSRLLNLNKNKQRFIYKTWVLNGHLFMFTAKGFCELKRKNDSYDLVYYSIERFQKKESLLYVYSACMSPGGEIYIGTTEGVYKAKSTTRVFDFFNAPETGSTQCFSKSCMAVAWKNNRFYFTQENTFCIYDPISKKMSSFTTGLMPSGAITSVLCDKQNNTWLGTNGDGIYLLSGNTDQELKKEKHFTDNNYTKYGLKCNFINCLFQSNNPNEDVVWIGSRDAGAFSYSYSKNSFELISASLKNDKPNFYAITKDKENVVWAGTLTGIYKIDRATNTSSFMDLQYITQKTERPIEAMYCDNKDEIWVGAANTLAKIDKKKNILTPVIEQVSEKKSNSILRITAINDNELLLGTSISGLYIYNKTTKLLSCINKININDTAMKIPAVGALFVDSKKNWWIGTNSGLFFIDKEKNDNRFFTYDPANRSSLLANLIMDIQERRNGEIIIATTKGLSILKDPHSGVFENIVEQQGLTNNFIYGLLRGKKGNFWMSTNYGIAVFDAEKRTFRSYHGADGVFINEFNSGGFYAAPDGELLFGGISGLIGLYPEKLVRNGLSPNIVLRSFKINQLAADSLFISTRKKLKLAYDQNNIYFEFSVPDFSGKRHTKLIYKLDGVQPEWTDLKDAYSLSLVNLAPGTYKLHVKAVNAEGIESPSPFMLSFVITPPFWSTWWFYSLLVLLLIGISWLIYHNRLREKISLLKEMEQVRQEENEKVRKAAALDLHDEFGNGLTRISMLVEMAKIKIPKEDLESVKLLTIISENSSRLYQGTKDFIWSINPGNDNVYEIIIRIKDFGDELFYGTGTNFEIIGLSDEFKELRQLPGSGRNIAMIFKEALSNILKHAKASKVQLVIVQIGDELFLRLKDNGKGFDQKVNKNSFGISNMNQRASRVGAELQVNSEINKGSEIVLIIKL